MHTTQHIGNNIVRHFSYDEYMDYVKQPNPMTGDSERDQSNQGTKSFTETSSYEEAMGLADNGWPEGLEKIKRFSGFLQGVTATEMERTRYKHREAGDECDVDRYLEGDPECMLEPQVERIPGFGKVVRVVYNSVVSAGVSTNAMFWRGAVGVAIVDMIETAGLRCEIIMAVSVSGLEGGKDALEDYILLKKADDHMELDRLAFHLAHPSSLRRLQFRLIEHLGKKYHPGGGYGMPRKVDLKGDDILTVDPMQYGFGNAINTEDDARKFCAKLIQEYVVPLGILETGEVLG